jgi:hypothetical protein
MANTHQPTLVDKVMLLPLVGQAIGALLYRMISRPFSGGAKASTYFKDVVFAALRTQLSNISPGTEQWVNGTTEAEYLTFAKKQKIQPDTTVLASGLKLHWLGSKTAEKVLVFFHGGKLLL